MEYKNRGKKRQVKGSWRVASSRGLEKLSRAFRGTTIVQYSNNTPGGEEENPQEKKKEKEKGRKKCQMPSSFQRPRYLKTGFEGEISCRTEETSSGNIYGSLLLHSTRRGEGGESMNRSSREREREIRNTRYIFLSLLIATSERSSRTVCRYAREREKCGISR